MALLSGSSRPALKQATGNLARPLRGVMDARPGSVVGFSYAFAKHDSHPLVLITGVSKGPHGFLIDGVNLHYLPASSAIGLLREHAGDLNFTAERASEDKIVGGAVRRYRADGVRGPLAIDWRGLSMKLAAMKDMDPAERAAMSKRVGMILAERSDLGLAVKLAEQDLATIASEQEAKANATQQNQLTDELEELE